MGLHNLRQQGDSYVGEVLKNNNDGQGIKKFASRFKVLMEVLKIIYFDGFGIL